jgi:Sigma-70 region 2
MSVMHPPVENVLSDIEIVELIKAGETSLFELIMRRYNQRLFRVIRSILKDDDEAQEVMQEAYVRAFEHLRQFEARAQFSTHFRRKCEGTAVSRACHQPPPALRTSRHHIPRSVLFPWPPLRPDRSGCDETNHLNLPPRCWRSRLFSHAFSMTSVFGTRRTCSVTVHGLV